MHILLPRRGEGGGGVKLLYRGMWKWILEKLLHCLFCILLSDRHRYDSTVYLVGELECMDKDYPSQFYRLKNIQETRDTRQPARKKYCNLVPHVIKTFVRYICTTVCNSILLSYLYYYRWV
jgi:hypothetical protein